MPKLGRKPPKNAPSLRLSRLLTGVAPVHPAAVDYGARITDWQMLGNDTYGDCVAVTWANSRYLTTTYLGERPVYPTLDQVLAVYRTQNPGFPGQDEGMDIQTLLEWLTKNPGPDGAKAVAFAKVDLADIDELNAAIALFGAVWLGIDVTAANETEFSQGKPWDYVRTSRDLGGHGVLSPAYEPVLRFITWGREVDMTALFEQRQVEEAWVVVWPEHLGSKTFLAGFDLEQLAADYQEITGRPLPLPAPAPAPIPAPEPAGDQDLDAWWAATRAWAGAKHTGSNKAAAAAARTLATRKGLS